MELWEQHLGQNYELVDVLKKTRHGTVALVYDRIGKQVCILKQTDARAKGVYLAIREMEPPQVPAIQHILEQNGKLLVIEEFIDGRTLADMLDYGELLEEREALRVLQELCLCLKPFHSKNIIHRDIKPSNIMLTKDGAVKLIDFSIARTVKAEEDTDTEFLGTKGYAPPEQYGFGQTDARSDIYSLGITLQRMLGKEYKGYLFPILKRCTAIDPANRYASVTELLEAMDQGCRQRHRKRAAICTGIICLLLGSVLWIGLRPTAPIAPKTELHQEHQEQVEQTEQMEQMEQMGQSERHSLDSASVPESQQEPQVSIDAAMPKALPAGQAPAMLFPDASVSAPPAKEPWKNRVFATLYLNGRPFEPEDSAIPQTEWSAWQQEGDATYFPQGWNLSLHLENEWEKDYVTPAVRITFDGGEETISLPTIPSGGSMDVPIPLAGKSFSSTRCVLDILVSSETEPPNAPPLYWDIQFTLENWLRYRMEQAHGNKK